MRKFETTHRIVLDPEEEQRGQEVIDVMLCESGRAYSKDEWDDWSDVSYECRNGSWTFHGRPFRGTVNRIAKSKGGK
jgi:hypothetical protein